MLKNFPKVLPGTDFPKISPIMLLSVPIIMTALLEYFTTR